MGRRHGLRSGPSDVLLFDWALNQLRVGTPLKLQGNRNLVALRIQLQHIMRWSEKSPALKILWVWTLGTAAILVANGVRNGLKEMKNLTVADQHQQIPSTDSELAADSELIREDKS